MDGNSYKQVSTWNTDEVISWIRGLDGGLEEHVTQFRAHCICGHDLLKLSQQQLEYLKVTQLGHQELLLEAVEQLTTLESSHSRNSTVSMAGTLTKKTSQLIKILNSKGNMSEGEAVLSRIELTAGVMTAAKALISWLERNPSPIIADYTNFKQEVLKTTLDLSSLLEDNYETDTMVAACRVLLSLTSALMSPENFTMREPVNLVSVVLRPREDTGLGFSIERTRQGNLLVSSVSPGSPADECGLGDTVVEIIQINSQNVVGWEVGNVAMTLKQSGHEVFLILKIPKLLEDKKDERDDQTDEGVVADSSSGSCERLQVTESDGTSVDELDMEGSGVSSPVAFQGDTDLSTLESVLRKETLDLKRTSSAPITDTERASTSKETDDGDKAGGGENTLSPPVSLPLLHSRTASTSRVESLGCNAGAESPSVAYRNQIVGGVVIKIPIKKEEGLHHKKSKPKNGPTTYGRSKFYTSGSSKKTKKTSVSSLTSEELPSPEPEPGDSPEKTRAVFSDAKEVTIGGTTAKQVTVTSTTEVLEGVASATGKKSANPALMVPCFQLKNADHEGWMNKQGGSGLTPKNWRRRWFVLKANKLYYYKTAFDITATGIVEVAGYSFEVAPEIKKKHAFKAVSQGSRTYYFIADSADEMTTWIQVLTHAASAVHDSAQLGASIEASDDEL